MDFQKILYFLAAIVIAFAGGFYLAVLLQGNVQILIGVAIIFAFLTWLGSGAELLGLLRDWYRQKTEEEKTPILKFAGLFKNEEPAYFVKVEMTKGEGKAEACEGFLFIEGTDINNIPTVWSFRKVRYFDIAGYMHLRLFKIEEAHDEFGTIKVEKSITFPLAKLEKGFTETRKRYDEIINKILTVKIYTKRGKAPEPFSRKMSDIIKDATKDDSLNVPVSSKYVTSDDD